MKRVLEEALRREKQSVSALLEKIVAQSLHAGVVGWDEEEAALQKRLLPRPFQTLLKEGPRAARKAVKPRANLVTPETVRIAHCAILYYQEP